MKKRAAGILLLIFILSAWPQSYGQEKLLDPGELYDSSMGLYQKGKCEEAIQGFSKIAQFTPTSKLVSYSQYMIGLCYLKMAKYEEAIQQFELYLKTFPGGDRAEEAGKGIQIAKEQLKEKSTAPYPTSKPAFGKFLSKDERVKRRICAQISYFEGKNLEELEKRMKELKRGGVNTVIFRIFQNKGDRFYKFASANHEEGVYFKTEFAPMVDDILGKVTEIAHRNGLEIFAWITTRYANYGLDGHPEYRCRSYNFGTKKMEMAKGFNLFHPDVLKRLEGLFRDLGRYPIDGILFQDDLILYHNEDFSPEANRSFLKEFGFLPQPDLFYIDPYKSHSGKYYAKTYTERFKAWANWKNRWLMNVAQRLKEAAKESNPNLKFAINLYFEAVLNEENSVAWFSQTLSGAMENSFDYYAIMAYHRQAMKDRNMDLKEAIALMAEVAKRAVKSIGDPSRVLMKVQILDWKNNEIVPQKEMEEMLAGILNQGEVSLAFFPYLDQFSLQPLEEKWTISK